MSDYNIHEHAKRLGVSIEGPNKWGNYMIGEPYCSDFHGLRVPQCYTQSGAAAFLCGVEAERKRANAPNVKQESPDGPR